MLIRLRSWADNYPKFRLKDFAEGASQSNHVIRQADHNKKVPGCHKTDPSQFETGSFAGDRLHFTA
jgi:hypothetical protein